MRIQITLLAACLSLAACGPQEEPKTELAPELTPKSFNAVWQISDSVTELKTLDGSEPPLLAEAKATYDENRQALAAGDRSFDGTAQCQPHGVPRLLFEEMPFEFMVQNQPDYVGILYQWNRLVRNIEMDKEHYEPLGPTYLGQSVGHWEGNTLVVDTNGFNEETLLDAAGMPHSDQLNVIERYSLSDDGNQLHVELTIEDPATFSSSWKTSAVFNKLPGQWIEEDVCVERLNLDAYK